MMRMIIHSLYYFILQHENFCCCCFKKRHTRTYTNSRRHRMINVYIRQRKSVVVKDEETQQQQHKKCNLISRSSKVNSVPIIQIPCIHFGSVNHFTEPNNRRIKSHFVTAAVAVAATHSKIIIFLFAADRLRFIAKLFYFVIRIFFQFSHSRYVALTSF